MIIIFVFVCKTRLHEFAAKEGEAMELSPQHNTPPRTEEEEAKVSRSIYDDDEW